MLIKRIASLTGLFAALCTSPAAAQTFSSLPDQGPLEDKACTNIFGSIRPGNMAGADQQKAREIAIQRGWGAIMGNDCNMRNYLIDAQGNAVKQDNDAAKNARPNSAAPAGQSAGITPPPAATAAPATGTAPATPSAMADINWYTQPGFLPSQVPAASIRATAAAGGCRVNGLNVPYNYGVILDNRTLWHVGAQCKLTPLVTVTRDVSQPVESAATRFDSAAELIGSIEKLYGDVSAQTGRVANPYFIKLLRGEAVPPMYPAQVAVKPYSGAGVVVDELLTMTIGIVKGIVAPNHLASSALMLPAPVTQQSTGTPLDGEWWNQPNLLPTSPQGTIASTGRDATGNCRITQNNRPLVSVAAGSIIIPDTTRAFAVLADCKVEPLITLPLPEPSAGGVAVSGGGIRNPGTISPGPNPGIGQAGLLLIQPAYVTARMIFMGLVGILGLEISKMQQAKKDNNVAVIPPDSGLRMLESRNAQGLSDREVGSMSINIANNHPVTLAEIEAGLRRTAGPGTKLANSLSPPGLCRPDDYNELERKKRQACPRVMLGCTGVTDPVIRSMRAAAFKACALAREEINKACFDAGSDTHRDQTRNVWNAVKNCTP